MSETLVRGVGFDDGGERKGDDNETGGGGAMGKTSNSDSTSSSDSEEDEHSEELRLEALRHSLSENPANYDSHVQNCTNLTVYIQCLRRLGHIEKLEQAREAMNAIFPLSSSMWKEWAKDALSINDGPEAFSTVELIYEKGVHEYLSVSLWCDYLNFVRNHDPLVAQFTPCGVSKMRNLFERAIIAAGLHLTEGHLIWDAYKDFEQAIYVAINDENSEEKAKQIDRIRGLFHRQLAIPLADLRSTLLSYKHWEVQLGNFSDVDPEELAMLPANVVFLYRKASEMCNARKSYEDQLSRQNTSDVKLQVYMNYIKLEESSGDPARVQVLYERAIVDFPIQSELWLRYTSYVDRILKVPHLLKDVYSRATRNCSWVKDLWVHYLLSLERVKAPDEELSVVFEKSLQCNFSKGDEYLDLFLTRIDGLRRRISQTSKNGGVEYDLIRDTFQRAAQYLSPDMAKPEDVLQLHIYWSRVEVNLLKDLTAARGVWETLIKKSGPTIDVWQAYIDMETAIGNINEARSIYRRCYTKRFTGTGSEDICRSWLRFEREFGSLDDFDLATAKVTPRLEQLRVFMEQQELKNEASLTDQKNDSVSKNVPQKRKIVRDSFDVQSPTKRQKRAPSFTTKGNVKKELMDVYDTAKGGNLDVSTSAMDDDGKVCETLTESLVSKETIQKEKQNLYTDQCTAFVSNLHLEANEEHIRKFFNDNGGVTAIRLLKDKFTGKSRGLAYVDFIDQDHLSAAIAKNKQKLLGQKISIARSDPKRQRNVAADGHDGQAQSRRPVERENKEASVRTTKDFVSHRRVGHVDLKGKNTFAMPRSVVRPLGWSNKESNSDASQSIEQPKSNEEFRKMFSKK